ncbi:MAG TPA: RluA family pseudouridine synthase [Bacteroidia bacterium]|jgi:23S rRNA pseudouridine1911/1915/1917 synthase|nr:RluA family pseudouridine synthase [Bacteroidia bacterium]
MSEEIDLPEEEQELFEHFRLQVDKGQAMLRIDKFLMHRLEKATRTRIQYAAEAGNILVNGKAVKSSYKVKPDDIIQIVLPHPPREIELIPQNIPINITYEDDDLIIVNKDPGMVVHPGYGNYTGTLVNALVYHFQQLPVHKLKKGEEAEGIPRPGLVHRIDKNTSGILVIAKNERSLTRLSKKFFDRDLDRLYVALVWGDMKEDEGTITGNLGRSLQDRKIMTVFPKGDMGKHAVTHWKVLERFGYVTLIQCKLETGRTHQIRAHLRYIGHPLFNDDTYGGDKILKGTTFQKYRMFIENCFKLMPRQGLHAKSLGFKHPTSGKYMLFESEIPADMEAVLKKWRTYTANRPDEAD